MTVSVLALDLAMNRSGYAVGKPDLMEGKPAGWGVFTPTEGKDMEADTMARLRALLAGIHERHNLTHIVYEHIWIDHSPNRHEYFGPEAALQMSGVVLEFGGTHGIHVSKVAVNDWRRLVYGFSKAQPNEGGKLENDYWKKIATAWAAAQNYFVQHHDEAEALAILWWALGQLDHRFAAWADPLFRRNDLHAMFRRGIHAD